MPKVDPQQATQKWVNRLSGATADIQAGIQRVSESPGVAAARKFDKWQAGVQAGANKWRRNVGAVTLQDWQQKALQVGVPRVAQGAQAKQDKYTAFAQSFFPHLDAGVAKIKQMPDVTLQDRIQRAVAMMQHNATYGGKGSGSGM